MACKYIKGYQANNGLMESYHDFTRRVFECDLVSWKNAGHWNDKYIPHSLIYNGRIIANISASVMRLQIAGKDIPAVQLGSVGVLPEYRGKGFSRILVEKVLEEYKRFPLIFLFANHSVLDFYPKFGFKRVNESILQVDVPYCCTQKHRAERISVDSEAIRRLLGTKLQYSSVVDARGNQSVYWFHLMYNFSEGIYYIEDKDIVFIVKYQDDCAMVFDVLSESPIAFEDIREYIQTRDTRKVYFYFTPDWLLSDYKATSNEEGDGIMYVSGEFPVDIANFKFPVTAHT